MPLDPQAEALLEQMAQAPAIDVHTMPAAEVRAAFDAMSIQSEGEAVARVENRMLPGPAGEIPVRIYGPDAPGPLPALAYFHGGGWVIGNLETHDATCRALANRAGCIVVSVDYRLAPEHKYPAAPEDCYAVTRWLAEQGSELGVDPDRIAVGGDSAGGNLSAVVAQLAKERGGPSLAFQLLVYPVTDHRFDTPSSRDNAEGYFLTSDMMRWFWEQYLVTPEQGDEPSASPLRAKDLAGLPPALVITAEYDPLRDEGEAYAKRLQEAGVATELVQVPGQIHGFFGMSALLDAGKDAEDRAGHALREAFARR